MCTTHYGDWSLHNQHFSGIIDFLSLTAKLLKTLSLRYWWWFLVRRWYLKSLGGKTLLAEHWMAPINTKWPRSFMIRVRKLGFKFQLGLIYRKRNWNEWFSSNVRLRYAHRIMGSPGGKHCKSLQRNVWLGAVSPLKAVSLDRKFRILLWFYEKRRWLMLVLWNCKFLWDQCDEIYR